jgi:prepilin signal peptidase PulO-like enzyme (type II secretory pathway)
MLTLFVVYFFILGLIIGSFLNVVILRHNTGKSTGGRSACMSCKTQLTYKELFPVFSFLFQKGRCKNCKTKLSWQYPLVELATGILFAANFYYIFQQTTTMFELIVSVGLTSCIWALMIVIFVYDLRHKIIPDVFSFTAFGLSAVYVFLSTFIFENNLFIVTNTFGTNAEVYRAWIPAFAGMTTLGAGIIFYLAIYILWKLSKGRLIGLGDAKLLLSIGTILGIIYGLSAIFISAWIGLVYVIYLLLGQRLRKGSKHITMRTEIPFGPFLILGFLIVYFTKIDVTNISFILENFS